MKVFLGGTCNSSTWRDEIIPMLKKSKIDYFNPVVEDWDEEAQKKELEERENCDYCLYVITPKMTGVYAIAEAVDDSNKRSEKTIFTVLFEHEGLIFDPAQSKSLLAVAEMVIKNNSRFFDGLQNTVDYLDSLKTNSKAL